MITMCLTRLTLVKEPKTAAEMDKIVKTAVQVLCHSCHYGRDTKREELFTGGQQNTQDIPTSPGRVIPTKTDGWMFHQDKKLKCLEAVPEKWSYMF